MTTHEFIVVGGGIAGLATAYALRARDVLLLEGSGHLGGNIKTLRRDGCIIELGPDALVTHPSAALDLCTELGVSVDSPSESRVLVAHRGALHALPEGLAFGVPRSFASIARTPLVSARGRLRAALDLVLPPRSVEGCGLGVIVERRLGREIKEALVEPLVSGVYGGELDDLDPAVVMPSLAGVRGSLIRALSGGAKTTGSPFRAPHAGMDTLVSTLVAKLGTRRCHTGAAVTTLRREGSRFVLETESGSFCAKRIVLATPPRATARLVRDLDPAAAGAIDAVRIRSSISVVLAFDKLTPRSASGLLVTRGERRSFVAATFVGEKWPQRVSPGVEVIRAVVDEGRAPELLAASDDAIVARVLADLRAYIELGRFRWTVVERFGAAAPIPDVGHRARVAGIRERLAAIGVRLCGAAWDGPGIAGCVRGARALAEELADAEDDRGAGHHRRSDEAPSNGVQ